MRILQCISGEKSCAVIEKMVQLCKRKKRVLGYLILSMLLCNTVLVSAEEVKIVQTEIIEYQQTEDKKYKELVNPTLVHKNADGSEVHSGRDKQC